METKELNKYEGYFSEQKFWGKIGKVAKKAGEKLVYVALILFYELKDPRISLKEKGVIIGALGYFILPLDLIPDAIPVAGFTDDLAALIAAYHFISSNVTPEIKFQAQQKVEQWFGAEVNPESLDIDEQ
ncbi:MAG: DUF1232 domain-containing protein [Bacteroidales bacterium]|nr:DUF1232 domain-containing protein [Bacteroidales bacterium]